MGYIRNIYCRVVTVNIIGFEEQDNMKKTVSTDTVIELYLESILSGLIEVTVYIKTQRLVNHYLPLTIGNLRRLEYVHSLIPS